MRALVLIIALLSSGCYTPITDLKEWIPEKDYKTHKTVDYIKKRYFTDKSYKIIKDVPCVDGFTSGGSLVVGVNFWGTFAGIMTGSGYSAKNVISKKGSMTWSYELFIHEYIHHVEHLVDHEKFKEAYIRMSQDRRWKGLQLHAERHGNKWHTRVFGISDYSEFIAYVGARLAKQRQGPAYMWDVFEVILRRP